MPMSSQLTPTDNVVRAADRAVPSDVSRTVLDETLDAAISDGQITESGRTWCSSAPKTEDGLKHPIARYPAAVELEGCPPGDLVVTWHTHTSPDQLYNPEHSLPDIANVAFGPVDVSIVPGIESDHVLVSAADGGAMAEAFRNAIGMDVNSPEDIVDALDTGTIPAPTALRDRAFDAFGSLVQRVPASRPGLAAIADDVIDPDVTPDSDQVCAGLQSIECDPTQPGGDVVASQPPTPLRASSVLRRESRTVAYEAENIASRFDIAETVVGTTVGMFTSRVLERAVFGE